MKQILEPLRTSALTNMEAGQLMRRHLSDLATIDPNLLTDAPFNNYVQEITDQTANYESALAQVRKNEETEKIVLADDLRDKAVSAFGIALKLHAASDDSAEVEASRMVITAMTETFDMKTIRTDLQNKYSDFADYMLSMAKALNTPLFLTALNLLNTARKYYADLLARRKTTKATAEKPVV